jgi:hypothetical protein
MEDVSGRYHCYEISEALVLNQNPDSLKLVMKILLAWVSTSGFPSGWK